MLGKGDIHDVGQIRFTYQTVHTTQCVIGVVQGVGQLVYAIVCLTVAIETHTHPDARKR